jgi:hypothetical protein
MCSTFGQPKNSVTMNTLLTLFLSALIPLIVGFIWYHPKVFGAFWMRVSGVTEEKMKTGNMPLIFILTYVLGFLISAALMSMVIHQMHIFSILADTPGIHDPESEVGKYFSDFMAKYGSNFRTFKHGAFHGTLMALFFVTPIISINAMFERRGFKYIAVHAGFWIVSLALMGGVVCQFVTL